MLAPNKQQQRDRDSMSGSCVCGGAGGLLDVVLFTYTSGSNYPRVIRSLRMLFPCVCCTAFREVRGPDRIPQIQSNTFIACVDINRLIYSPLIRLVYFSVCLPFGMLNAGKDASFSDMEHDQLVVLVKGAVCSSLTEKMDPLFEQLTASVQSSLLSVAQQSLQITRQMAAADVSSLKQELSLVTTSVKTLAAQLSECMAEVRSMLLANSKDNRPSTQEW